MNSKGSFSETGQVKVAGVRLVAIEVDGIIVVVGVPVCPL